MTATPEHEKLHKVQEKSQAIGEFLEWLTEEKRYSICQYVNTIGEVDCEGEEIRFPVKGYLPILERIEQLLAEYFDIDLDKLELEKRAMLDELRRPNAKEPCNPNG